MTDSWCDRIVDDGVVLVGDAAGWNDPVIGQGVSIALRDARLVSEVLLGSPSWSASAFAGYVEERIERMRRLRLAAHVVTLLRIAFGTEAASRRRRWFDLAAADPWVLAPLLAALVGPDRVGAEAFTDSAAERVRSVDCGTGADTATLRRVTPRGGRPTDSAIRGRAARHHRPCLWHHVRPG